MKKTIFVVEDDKSIREVIGDILNDYKLNIVNLATAQNLKKKVEKYTPACIVMDIMLPGKKGHVAAMELKTSGYPNLPIILMSAGKQLIQKKSACHADAIIQKPFDNKEFIEQVLKFAKL